MDKQNLSYTGIKAALFDMDGVLLDSLNMWYKIACDFMRENGVEMTERMYGEIRVLSFLESAQYFIDELKLCSTPQMLIDEWNARAAAAYKNEIGLLPGVEDYVRKLSARGIHLAIVTASDAGLARAALKRLGLSRYFDAIITEADARMFKSGPEIFLLAAKTLDAPPETCIVFEDSLYAAKAAKAAGMKVWAMCSAAGADDAADFQGVADRCFESFEELMEQE